MDKLNESQKEELTKLFKQLDKDNTGFLGADEVKNGLKKLYGDINLCMSDADIDHLIKSVDKNGDGKVQIDEFIGLL